MSKSRWKFAGGGARLAYLLDPDPGNPVVLLHSLATSARTWEPVRRALGGRLRLLTPDCRGHGRSETGPMSPSAWADDLARILDDADVNRCVVGGVSLGGIQALAFAARHPDRVTGVVAADTFAHLEPAVATARIGSLVDQASTLTMVDVAEQYVADTFTDTPPPASNLVAEEMAAMPAAVFCDAVRACFSVDIRADLAQVRCPAVVAWGENDTKTPRALSEAITDGLPDAELVVIPAAGHLSHLDNAPAFAGIVLDFHTRLAATTGQAIPAQETTARATTELAMTETATTQPEGVA
ncbi:alpha/beta fold hydrolase [Amycolatopsis pithecellobii]|nr:alpha/beta hydrolase [Amycolatopsis pithecellobii]